MFVSHLLRKANKIALFSICALLIFIKTAVSQPFKELIDKILLQDESINSSKTLIKKNRNDLSSAISDYTPKLNLSVPYGKEILINNDSTNTKLNY